MISVRARLPRKVALGSVLAAGCLAAAVATPAAAGADRADDDRTAGHARGGGVPKLFGVVGPDDDIEIDQDSVPAGRYKIIVRDRSDDHNFHMFHLDDSSLFNKKTGVDQEKKVVWTATLAPGRYRIHCDPHRDDMKTFLTVT